MAGTKILPKCSMMQAIGSGTNFRSPWTGNWYVGGIGSDGNAYVAKYSPTYNLQQLVNIGAMTVDEHCMPSILELRPDGNNPGKLLVASSKHVDASYGWLSTSAGDIRDWGASYTIESASPGSTFCFLYQANDTAKTIFCIYTQANQRWGYRTSTTGASGSWSSFNKVYDSGTISVQPIVRPCQDPDNPNIIHWILHPGNIGAFYHLYMVVQSDGSVKWYKSDGTDITSTLGTGWTDTSNFTPVAGDSTSNTFEHNIYSGKPAVLFTKASAMTGDPYGVITIYLAKWTGSAWTTETVGAASSLGSGDGSYEGPAYKFANYYWSSGGVYLDPADINTIYQSIAFNGTWSGSPPTSGQLTDARVQKWVKSGGTWGKNSDVTGNTGNINYVQNGLQLGGQHRFFFTRGTQTYWTSWSTDVYTYPDLSLNTTKAASPVWTSAAAPLNTNAYYLLYEGTGGNGSTLHDVTGSYSGAIVRGSSLAWGTGTYGAELSGFTTSDYVQLNSLASALTAAAYPWWLAALWKTTDATNMGYPIAFGRSSNNNPILNLRVNSSGNSNYVGYFFRTDDATEETVQVATGSQGRATMSDGNYHVLQCTFVSATARRLYYDGAFCTSSGTNYTGKAATFDRGAIGVTMRASASGPFPGTVAAVLVGWGGPTTAANADAHAAQIAWDLMSGQFGGTRQQVTTAAIRRSLGNRTGSRNVLIFG